jgi:hypothetical protein
MSESVSHFDTNNYGGVPGSTPALFAFGAGMATFRNFRYVLRVENPFVQQ